MAEHVVPDGEDEHHVECASCWCMPFEQARLAAGGIEWVWVHEPMSTRRRRARLKAV